MAACRVSYRALSLYSHKCAVRGINPQLCRQREPPIHLVWRQFNLHPEPPTDNEDISNPPKTSLLDDMKVHVRGSKVFGDPPDYDVSNPPEYVTSILDEKGPSDTLDEHHTGTQDGDIDTLLDEATIEQLNMYNEEFDFRDVLQREGKDGGDKMIDLETLPIMHVRCTFNNTMINICDHTGKIRAWKSCGSEGYKHSRKGTSVAAQSTAQAAAIKAHEFGYHKVRVKLKGLGTGRQYALKGFELGGLQIASIQDVTPVPHNGCKPKKKRRI